MDKIQPIAIPGIHERFLKFFTASYPSRSIKVLDLAAGHGAFTQELFQLNYDVEACDLFPEHFHFDKVVCKKADLTKSLPFDDNYFDVVVAMEVTEHIMDHEVFFREIHRILKPGGRLLVSTPNILSLKSRWRYFMSGFFYTFKPLELRNYNGLQHTASLTADQYNYLGVKFGFKEVQVNVDKYQGTSIFLMVTYPLLWLHSKLKKVKPVHNTRNLLLGRILFLVFEK